MTPPFHALENTLTLQNTTVARFTVATVFSEIPLALAGLVGQKLER